MRRSLRWVSCFRDSDSGAAAVEFAIISLALILVSVGVVEFGRSFQLRNELSYAADFGSRKILMNSTISDSALESEVRSAFTVADPDLLQVTIGNETVAGIRFRTIALSYPLNLLVPGLSSDAITLALARRTPVY